MMIHGVMLNELLYNVQQSCCSLHPFEFDFILLHIYTLCVDSNYTTTTTLLLYFVLRTNSGKGPSTLTPSVSLLTDAFLVIDCYVMGCR